jgi:two-component system LytT family sensor kinase
VVAFEGLRSRWYARQLGSDADLATFRTLHTASLASPALREGLNPESVQRSLRHLRNLLGTAAVAMTDTRELLGYDGLSTHHSDHALALARRAVESTGTVVAARAELACETQGCLVHHAIASPLVIEDRVAGALVALTDQPSANLLRATEEVASWVSGQLELAELDESRHRLMRAEVRALRAQISPHFIYNSLGAIASFVRTDPDRARDLLLEFADFTRYSFRQHGDFTTLAEELRSVERYLLLEQARFGDRLRVTLQVAPEVLGVNVPFLCLQPLVENAVQHGLESMTEGGRISIEARDADRECVISIEDNGAGQDPERIRAVLSGQAGGESVGLANVDERLRTTFGDEYGLVVETAPGAGTKVVVRVPKFAPGVIT